MILQIATSDKNAIEYACGLTDYKCIFYSNESKPGMCTVEILDSYGEEPTRELAWYLARQVEAKLACDGWAKK